MDKYSEFQKVVKAVSLRELFMVSANCECHIYHGLIEPKNTVLDIKEKKIETNFDVDSNKKEGTIFSKVYFTIVGLSNKDMKINKNEILYKRNTPLFTISASYVVVYNVNKIDLDEDAVEYFGTHNAYFNVYPYLREFIANISQRFNISPLVIPLLKPGKQPKKPVKQSKKRRKYTRRV